MSRTLIIIKLSHDRTMKANRPRQSHPSSCPSNLGGLGHVPIWKVRKLDWYHANFKVSW